MDIAVEISLYPLNADFIPPIQDFIDRLNRHAGLKVMTNPLSTQVFGDHDRIFEVLRQEMGASFAAGGKATVSATFSAPGEYVIRVQSNDSSGEGGGGFQCCWTNVHVKVNVK
jgi:uncharacterized protein YqgV (UPF0045/DUF77 family)